MGALDYRVYHAVYTWALRNHVAHAFSTVENWLVPILAVATFALWLLARPGGSRRPRGGCAGG